MSRTRRSVRVRLPELSAREAVAASHFLYQLDLALWAANADEMLLRCEGEGRRLIFDDREREQKTVKKRRH